MNDNEEERDKLLDFMSKISFWMLEEIEILKKEGATDTLILEYLIENFKHNISLCPEAALEAKYYEKKT